MKGKPRKARIGANAFTLTPTERRIVFYIGQLFCYDTIAELTRYKRKTVEAYVERIAMKIPEQGDLTGHKKVLAFALINKIQEAA